MEVFRRMSRFFRKIGGWHGRGGIGWKDGLGERRGSFIKDNKSADVLFKRSLHLCTVVYVVKPGSSPAHFSKENTSAHLVGKIS